MILILKAVIVGIVEGITEFLPISSTGHMIIIGNLIGFTTPKEYVDMFEIVIQLGAILSVIVLYWDKIWNSLVNLFPGKVSFEKSGLKLWTNMLIAFLPAAVIGFLVHKKIQEKLFNTFTVSIGFIVGGILLVLIENRFRKKYTTKNIENVGFVQAFQIGCFQCLSLWPGMSRSASTIMGGWISGLSTPAAAEFSFFLAIPTMIAASGWELLHTNMSSLNEMQIIALAVGFITSFLVALLVIEKFIGFLQKKPMRVFGIYRIFMGVLFLILSMLKVISV